VDVPFDEPAIPPRLRRPLAALWISLGVHAAVIALVQIAPPAAMPDDESVIEARLVLKQSGPPAVAAPPRARKVDIPVAPAKDVPAFASSVKAEALPVATPVPPLPAQPEPPVPLSLPAEPESAAAPPEPAAAPPAVHPPAPLATITSSVDLTYYSARDVDMPPRALREIEPEYPYAADRQRLSGKVRLQLKLEADGRVNDIEVVSATPPGLFEESALRAFREARFVPAQRNGGPVRALVLIEVVYDWEGRPR
jgi:protein TonB